MKKTRAEHSSKGLRSWSQSVAMVFCQLGRAHSLRGIEGGLTSCEGKLVHLGIEAPARSSLVYANGHWPWQLFEKVFYGLFEVVAAKAVGKKKFRFKNKPVSLDSTVIDLCLSMCDWAKRRTKGAVKLQIWMALIPLLPRYLQLSSRFGWSLANLVALQRMNLFTHHDLMACLNEPFATSPDPQDQPQATLAFV